ncbi:MAG TPA: cytochrome c biogenesis protein CcdC [Chitinophagaceae bacterium]|nr:cytochrome c biogenesis protein CcdC [Chitinophagaceae bacterium]
MFLAIASSVVAMLMAVTMIFYRLKASEKPASVKKIILPPIFMSTGALMFFLPTFQVSWVQVIEALLVGVIFSLFLIKTSNFEVRDQQIYLIPSKAFAFILFGLLGVRVIAKLILNSQISLGETSGMFFLLAFGMIGSWRVAMLYKFKKIEKDINRKLNPHSN